eukprot:1856377-Prymnesium_polylepis.1
MVTADADGRQATHDGRYPISLGPSVSRPWCLSCVASIGALLCNRHRSALPHKPELSAKFAQWLSTVFFKVQSSTVLRAK